MDIYLRQSLGDSNALKGILLAGVGIPLFIFACITHERCGVWKDSITLWSDVIDKSPCAVAFTKRGSAYSAKGDNDRAYQDFTQAIILDRPRIEKAIDEAADKFQAERKK